MLFEYTPQQKEKLNKIRLSYIERLRDPETTDLIKIKLREELRIELEEYINNCKRDFFDNLGIKDDPDAVLEDAQNIIKPLIEKLYNDTVLGMTAEDIKRNNLGTEKNNRMYVNTSLMFQMVSDELKHHLEALKEHQKQALILFTDIVDSVENSKYTDGTKIDFEKSAFKMKLYRFRRDPLVDLKDLWISNDKVGRNLIQDEGILKQDIDGQIKLLFSTEQANTKEEKSKGLTVPARISLSYTNIDDAKFRLTRKLNAFDKAVYDVIGNRFHSWRSEGHTEPLYITPQEIWRTMNGKQGRDGNAKPHEKQIARIIASIDKMRSILFYMNIEAEIGRHNLMAYDERVVDGEIETYLLNASKFDFMTEKGRMVTGYRIVEDPIIFTYNSWKKTLIKVPFEMLDTSATVSDGENVTEFKMYLLTQIQLMKNGQEDKKKFQRANTILLETIYRETGILPPEERTGDYENESTRQQIIRRNRKADREKIERILDAWKEKKYIKGYVVINQKNEPVKGTQQARGFRISL